MRKKNLLNIINSDLFNMLSALNIKFGKINLIKPSTKLIK